jgi:hypothetical protein
MELWALLRRLLPLVLLAGVVALLLRRRRSRLAAPVQPVAFLGPGDPEVLLLPAASAEPVLVTSAAATEPEQIVVSAAPQPRFVRERVDIVTVVDDLLAGRSA